MSTQPRRGTGQGNDEEATNTDQVSAGRTISGMVRLHDTVQATRPLSREANPFSPVLDVADVRDLGDVEFIDEDGTTMVRWSPSGIALDCVHLEDFEVLAGENEFKDEASTPKKPRRVYVRRGAQ